MSPQFVDAGPGDAGAGGHPDDDLLADLGEGLLQGEEARRIEAHVVACDVCVALLERSEALTGSLRRLGTSLPTRAGSMPTDAMPTDAMPTDTRPTDARPTDTRPTDTRPTDTRPTDAMPADVAARLERVLAGADATVAGPGRTPERPAEKLTEKPAETGPTRILKPMTTSSATRMVRPGSGARRQQLTEERDEDRSFRLTRYGRMAAAAVLVIGVGVGAVAGVRSLSSSGDEAGATASDSAAAGRAAVATVLATGTNYDAGDLKRQVDKLLVTSRQGGTIEKAEASGATGSTRSDSPSALAATGGSGLADDAKLAACLTAIGRGGEQPVAVDLARYQDQEAAVIVLQEADGTLDVWVVARTCAPGADGTIAVKMFQP